MADKTKKRTKAKEARKRTVNKRQRTPAIKTKVKIAANAGKPTGKSVTEVAAAHFKNLDYELGHLIPSAWWRHTA